MERTQRCGKHDARRRSTSVSAHDCLVILAERLRLVMEDGRINRERGLVVETLASPCAFKNASFSDNQVLLPFPNIGALGLRLRRSPLRSLRHIRKGGRSMVSPVVVVTLLMIDPGLRTLQTTTPDGATPALRQ